MPKAAKHDFEVGDNVVKETWLGGSIYNSFGKVIRTTPTTVEVEFYKSSERRVSADSAADIYETRDTCAFEELSGESNETFRWLRTKNRMGQAQRGSLSSVKLLHYKEGEEVKSISYL